MRTGTIITLGGLLAIVLCAGCQRTSVVADYTGAWRGTGTVITSSGPGTSEQEWVFQADPSGRLTATNTWRIAKEDDRKGFTHDGEEVRSDTEHLIGIIDFEGDHFVLVEMEENGTIRGRLLPDGRIRLVRSQPRGSDSVVMMTTLSPVAR